MNMRDLLALWLFVIAALLANFPSAAESSGSSSCIPLHDFMGKFPEAVQDGECYLLRLDGCRIVAVGAPYSPDRIKMIFVNSNKKTTAQKVAQRLVKEFSGRSKIVPFEGSDPGVAIIFTSGSQRSTRMLPYSTSIILYPDRKRSVRFTGWQGKLLQMQVDYEPIDDLRKKHRGVIEILRDVTTSSLEHVEFRTAKGRIEKEDMLDFLDVSLSISSSDLPEFTPRERRELRSKFPGQDIVVYNTNLNFCITNRGRSYHVGTIDGVSSYLSSKRSLAKFNFPEQDMAWPGQPNTRQNSATADNRTTKKGDQNMDTPAIASAKSPAPAATIKDTPNSTDDNKKPAEQKSSATAAADEGKQKNEPEPFPTNMQREIIQYVQMLQSL